MWIETTWSGSGVGRVSVGFDTEECCSRAVFMCLFLQFGLEADQRLGPGLHVSGDPTVVQLLNRDWIEVVVPLPSLPARHDELRAFEDPQMLHDGEPAELRKL